MNPFLLAIKLCLILCAVCATPLNAQAKTGYEVMQQVRAQSRIHSNQTFDIFMQIRDSRKRARKRYFTSWNKYGDLQDQSLVRFYRPSSLSGTSMLSAKKPGESSHQWIYLPAFRSVKKLSRSDRDKSFMGSDFSNADIGGRGLDEDTHRLVSEDDSYYRITSTPKSQEDPYGRLEYTILKSPLAVAQVDFYDRNGELLKRLTSRKIQAYEGMYIVVDSLMENPNTESSTTLVVEKVDLATIKPDNFYSPRGMKQ